MHMRDREVVASVVAGDPEGLTTAYDRYADSLYRYCRMLLRDPADAADAVQDTFVIAAWQLGGLRDPRRLRAWLYAVARSECMRIVRARKGTSVLDEAFDVTDDYADVSEEAGRADLRALFDAAKEGLNPGEREIIELQLRAGLEPGEVADVLGVSRNHAHALLSRARDQLETCLGALLVGRAGREECVELNAMLIGWDGRLTVLLRKRLHRHIERCGICMTTRASLLRPAMLLDLSPGAALAAGAALSFRVAPGAPEGLRGHTLALATGHGPAAAAHSAAVLSRAGGFTKTGFPKPAGETKAVLAGRHAAGGLKAGLARTWFRSAPQGWAMIVSAVLIVVAIAATAFALTGSNQHFTPTANPRPPAATVSGPTSALATAAASLRSQTANPATSSPAPGKTKPATDTTSAPPPAETSPPPSASRSPAPTAPLSPSPAHTPTGTLSEFPGGGTAWQPQELMLQPGGQGTPIQLSASGGTVNWSITIANDPGGVVSVSQASGTLTTDSPSVTVRVTASQNLFCGRGGHSSGGCPTITVSPGGAVYSIWTAGHFHGRNAVQASPPSGVSITTLAYSTETNIVAAKPAMS